MHETIRLWEDAGRPDGSILRTIYQSQWDLAAGNLEKDFPDHSTWTITPRVGSVLRDLELRETEGRKQALRFCERAFAESDKWLPYRLPDGNPAAELRFELDFTDFVVVGYIDQLIQDQTSGAVYVRDYKSGNDEHENKRQLGIYGLAARETWDLDVTHGEYWYTKLDRSSGWKDLRMYNRSYVGRNFESMVSVLGSKNFLANPTKKQCQRCSVRQYCEENAA